MKKFIIPFLIVTAFLIGGYKYGFKRLFTPSVIEKVRTGGVRDLKKQADESEELFRKELASAEKVGYRFVRLAQKYMEHKDWSPAVDSLKKAVEYGRSGARVHFLLATAYANRAIELGKKSDIQNAEKHYKRSLKINPRITDARYGLAILTFYLKKRNKEAIKIMKRIVTSEPDYYRAGFALGRFYYENSQVSFALSEYEKLYSRLGRAPESSIINEYRKQCSENISRLMLELSGR